jgi:hypothetical protein
MQKAKSDRQVGNFVDALVATQYRPKVFYLWRLHGYHKR